MKSLPKPQFDIEPFVRKVVAERQNGPNAKFFKNLEAVWVQQCLLYEQHQGDSVRVALLPFDKDETTSFRTLYTQPSDGSVQKPFIDALRKREMTICPLCGEMGTPWTLDHYLPQEHFPHFAILPSNLVPSCDICQSKKRSRYRGLYGRLTAHPYYHGFLNSRVVLIRFEPDYNAPKITLAADPSLPVEDAALLNDHLWQLGLHERFKTWFKTSYISVLRAAKRVRVKSQDLVTMFENLRDHHGDTSLNSWDYILWDSVLRDDALMSHLDHGNLPSHILP